MGKNSNNMYKISWRRLGEDYHFNVAVPNIFISNKTFYLDDATHKLEFIIRYKKVFGRVSIKVFHYSDLTREIKSKFKKINKNDIRTKKKFN